MFRGKSVPSVIMSAVDLQSVSASTLGNKPLERFNILTFGEQHHSTSSSSVFVYDEHPIEKEGAKMIL